MSERRGHAHVHFILLGAALISLALVVCLAGAGQGAAATRHRHCGPNIWRAPRRASNHQLRTATLCLVNRTRRRHGLRRLSFNPDLRRSATALSRGMVDGGFFSHYGPGGSTPFSRIARSGYFSHALSYRLAENIAVGGGRAHGSPAAIVRAWMHSPEHRANILEHGLRDFAVGIARGDPFGGGRRNTVTYTLDLAARGHH